MKMRSRLLVGLLVLIAVCSVAKAQDWPLKQPIKVIVTNTPGSALDLVSRLVFEQVGRQVGQTFVIENRPGAANTIGIATVAKAEPDGYTILAVPSSIAIVPHTHNLSYNTERDLRTVIPLGNLTNVMLTGAGRFKTVKDLVAAAKAKPDAVSYASIGPGSTGHMSAERLALSAGFKALHVPFKGSPEAVREIASGRVDFFFTPVGAALGLIRDGKVDTIAVSSSSRSSLLPDVPTTVQAGYPNSEYDFWIGVFVPSGVPQPVITRLHQEIQKVLQTADIKDRLTKLGVEPMPMSSNQFQAYLGKEIKTNETLVKAAKISAQ
jgi:tripartite-type tricarboxylate transporter receptor subunit TctC